MDVWAALGRGLIGLGDNLMQRISRVTYLPPAAADVRGALVRLEGADGVADKLEFAYKDAADAVVWTDLLASSGGGGTGDFSSNTATSVAGEVVLFADASGKLGKRATGSGLAKLASGVLGTATSGTDYAPATSGSAILKGNGAGGFSSATSGTDYAPATSGSAILKGNGSGGFASATSGTDYAPATSGSSLLKGNGAGGFSNAASGTDYAPATSGSAILKGNGSGGFASAASGTDYAPATSGSAILKGNGSGGFSSAVSGTDYAPASTTGILRGNGSGGFAGTTIPSDATKFLNGAATPAYAQVKDSDLALSDITTNNASTSNHGFVPKLDGNSAHFLNGAGAWATPSGTGSSSTILVKSNTSNSSTISNTTTETAYDVSCAFTANQLTAGAWIQYFAVLLFTNNQGATRTFTIKLRFQKAGPTNVYTALAPAVSILTGTTNGLGYVAGWIKVVSVGASGTFLGSHLGTASASGANLLGGGNLDSTAVTFDTTAAQTLQLTATPSFAATTLTTTLRDLQVWLYLP